MILFTALLGLIAFKLAVTDVYSDMFTAQPSGELPTQLAAALIKENQYELSENELNDFAAFLLDGLKETSKSDITVSDIYIDLKPDSLNRCYVRTEKGGYSFCIALDCHAYMENDEIVVSFENATIGKLPIPSSVLSWIIQHTALCETDYISTDSETNAVQARFPTHYGLPVPGMEDVISVDIISIYIDDDGVLLTTEPVMDETLQDVASYLNENFGGLMDEFMSIFSDDSDE